MQRGGSNGRGFGRGSNSQQRSRGNNGNGQNPPTSAWPCLPQAPGQAPAPRPLGVQGFSGGDGPRAPNPMVIGRATQHRDAESEALAATAAAAAVAGPGAVGGIPVAQQEGRGSVRGRRVITEVIHTRPASLISKCGKTGEKISVQTNYFRILKKPEWSIHHYRVDFSPEIDMIRVQRAYLAQHKTILGGYIFDGTMLFCTQKFSDNPMELLTKNREGETILIKIKHVGVVDSTDIQQLQVLNLILRRSMEGLNLQLVNRNFFDPVAKVNLREYRLELWPGYATSIRQHENDVLLCCEITHKVMRNDTLYHILQNCIRENANSQDAFKRQVIGSIVLTDYNNKTYRIDDVDFNTTPSSTFQYKDGNISYVDYYKQRYNITIRDVRQPMLVSRPTERNIRGGNIDLINLIPELSRATGITDDMRNNYRLMSAMSEHTRLMPDRRIDRLMAFNRRLNSSTASAEVLNSWNMNLDSNLVEVPARVLPKQKILFGNNSFYVCDERADWNREWRNNRMYLSHDIKRWIVIAPNRNMKEVQDFVQMCQKAARGMSMRMDEPRFESMPDDRNNAYSQAIDNAVAKDPQILMVVLTKKNEEKYACIKKKCCVDRPIPSQVVTLSVIAPRGNKAAGLMSVATKVVIQMNAKLNGIPWFIQWPIDGLMTVGFDVCHSGKDRNKSFGALVATMDVKKSPRYYSNVMQHMKGQELSNEIAMSMSYALVAYREEHRTLPERILFYRDGVGDGQLHQVVNTEIRSLKKKLDEIYIAAGIKTGCRMCFIVVSKRINTRYFVRKRNPEPGTVVDDIITLPERYDFFLVSQSVRQGTVSPTSYNVIYDSMGLDADKLQILTYKMTHLYYNWCGTCRVPAVCQYAHKLAALIAESVHRSPSNRLEKQLYFL